jgi:UDP-N-acetylglucosamine 2-epimerase
MKLVTVVGARPQFIKAAPLSRELRKRHREYLVHTGQHYDENMSEIFFSELGIPAPDVDLGVGSGSHGAQTASMLSGIEEVLQAERPDSVLVYGDTNSTLAGALAAAKLTIPVIHVEAGLRSYNRKMPEELNRVVTDHLSFLNLCPSDGAVANLRREGVTDGVHLVGDVMSDSLQWAREQTAARTPKLLETLGLSARDFVLCTIHRGENTDDPAKLAGILGALNQLDDFVVFPVHPRTRKCMEALRFPIEPHVRLIKPAGYIDMIALAAAATAILTDSGGLQKEAYWLGVPCITLRDETEWTETVAHGWNVLTGADAGRIVHAMRTLVPPASRPSLYGDGHVAARCVALIEANRVRA